MGGYFKKHDIIIGRKKAAGIEIPLPEAPLVLIMAPKGYLMCGYLDLSAAEKFGAKAAIISGVTSTAEMLKKPVVKVTQGAQAKGIVPGMSGEEALKRLF